MPSAEAQVQTSNASRYLARLCQHASKMGRPQRHRPRTHGGSGGPPEILHAECSDTEGSIVLNLGKCVLQADPTTLTLRADAPDDENLTRIQAMIAGRLEKFGRRENLSVTWHRTPAEYPRGV
jgi:hypothetical protein